MTRAHDAPLDGLRRARTSDLMPLALEVAPTLLGGVLRVKTADGIVAIRITEVEAYHGLGSGDRVDPGSHARMGRTERNATMWGECGHLYVYLSHGIHSCVNVACGPVGRGDGVLLRAGEVIEGIALAAVRRSHPSVPRDLARGPGRFGQAIGLRHPVDDGIDAVRSLPGRSGAEAELWLRETPLADVRTGPRVGVAGIAGTDAFPWRFWIDGDPTVSPFRPGRGVQALQDSSA